MKPFFRKLHRWLGLLMALQIIAWMASGLYFSLVPIEVIRGEHLTHGDEPLGAEDLAGVVTPEAALSTTVSKLPAPPDSVEIRLVNRNGEAWYRISGSSGDRSFRRMVHGRTGELRAALDQQAALARADQLLRRPGSGARAEWVEQAPPGSEIRGRDLPVWRVSYSEPESLRLYLDPWTGDLLARRTTRWRVFDFLWMLHIMDFDERDDFNTPLLQVAAVLGLVVAISGLLFWLMTSRLFRRRPVRTT